MSEVGLKGDWTFAHTRIFDVFDCGQFGQVGGVLGSRER